MLTSPRAARRFALQSLAVAIALGCGGKDDAALGPTGGSATGGNSGGGNAATGNAATGGNGAVAGNPGGSGGATSDELLPLPLVVDFSFFPSGAFGRLIDEGLDGALDGFEERCSGDDTGEWDNVTTDQTAAACPTRPAEIMSDLELSLSRCNSFAFTPAGLDEVDQSTWAGVLFQNTPCNWGNEAGSPIEPGATTLSFWAWSDEASVGSNVVFQAGGVGESGTPHRDAFTRTLSVDLTAAPTRYEIDLSTASYPMGVISAFGWTAERTDLAPLTFYVDGMKWE